MRHDASPGAGRDGAHDVLAVRDAARPPPTALVAESVCQGFAVNPNFTMWLRCTNCQISATVSGLPRARISTASAACRKRVPQMPVV